MWILISKAIFNNSGNISQFNTATGADYSKALWYDRETGEVREATQPDGTPITNIENYILREQEGTIISGPPPGSPDNPGPAISEGVVTREPRAQTPAEIEAAFEAYYNDENFIIPGGFVMDEETKKLVPSPDLDILGVPEPIINPDDLIAGRLATQGIEQFLGFDDIGTPLGYKGAGEGYGDNPVYTSALVTTLFMDEMYSEDYIRRLQKISRSRVFSWRI